MSERDIDPERIPFSSACVMLDSDYEDDLDPENMEVKVRSNGDGVEDLELEVNFKDKFPFPNMETFQNGDAEGSDRATLVNLRDLSSSHDVKLEDELVANFQQSVQMPQTICHESTQETTFCQGEEPLRETTFTTSRVDGSLSTTVPPDLEHTLGSTAGVPPATVAMTTVAMANPLLGIGGASSETTLVGMAGSGDPTCGVLASSSVGGCGGLNGPVSPPLASRSNSRGSLNSNANVDVDVCRICHCESEPDAPLISPCVCSGTLKFVHQSCLQQWIKSADTKSCELCKFDFEMTTQIKPFRKWQKLEMTTVERRKIMCSVTFHIIAITCVIWSLYVLIDRTTEEIRQGILEWPFWTKLIVVAIGFTGGLVFMYVQCKMYVQLCRRWRAYNRVIYIQNCPNGPRGQKLPLQAHTITDKHLEQQARHMHDVELF